MALFVLRKMFLQTHMRSHQVGIDVWFLVGPFVYFHTSCELTAKSLARLCGCAGSPEPSLVACVISTIIPWAGSNIVKRVKKDQLINLLMMCFAGWLYSESSRNYAEYRINNCRTGSDLHPACSHGEGTGGGCTEVKKICFKMSRDMTKPTKWVCIQWRLRSAWVFLIRVFAVRMRKAWVHSYPLSAERRLWSDWADAQVDPSLRWAHTHFVGFVMSWLSCCLFIFKY